MHVFSVVNAGYLELAEFWAERLCAVSPYRPHFYCADNASFERLSALGYDCHLRLPPMSLSTTSAKIFETSPYPNDHAAYTNFLKLHAGREALGRGEAFVYSDLDALWLKDPAPMLEGLDLDLAFQPGSFPMHIKKHWGFAMCAGFFLMRPTPATVALLDAVTQKFSGSDQLAFNKILAERHDIVWETRPQNWEHCNERFGWTGPILGHCQSSGLRLAALPHAYFQRHNLQRGTLPHCVICHPLSPKIQSDKFKAFAALGLTPN